MKRERVALKALIEDYEGKEREYLSFMNKEGMAKADLESKLNNIIIRQKEEELKEESNQEELNLQISQEMDEKFKENERRIEEMERDYEFVSAKNREYQLDVIMKSKVIQSLKDEMEHIKQQHGSLNEKVGRLSEMENQLSNWNGRLWEMEEELEEKNDKVEELENELEKEKKQFVLLKGENDSLGSLLKASQDKISEIEDTIQDQGERLEEMDQLLTSNISLKDEVGEMIGKISSLNHQLQSSNESIFNLELKEKNMSETLKEKDGVIEELERVLLESNEMKTKVVVEKEEEISELKSQNESLSKELDLVNNESDRIMECLRFEQIKRLELLEQLETKDG